ncbi:MAG: cupredoxin domain-containing protein [Acidimicrobiales bacterium]
MKTIRAVAGVLALGMLTSACAMGGNVPLASLKSKTNPTAPGPVAKVVVLEHFSFGPSLVTINPGQTVEWIWRDPGVPHNVTFANFQSLTKTAGVYFHTFTKPGTYSYRCTLHYDMKATVVVR